MSFSKREQFNLLTQLFIGLELISALTLLLLKDSMQVNPS